MIGVPMALPPSYTTQRIRYLMILALKIPRQVTDQRFAEQEIDLTVMQHHLLVMIERHHPTMADMARHMGVDPSTLVPMVDALVKKGYIERRRDPDDRRRYPLYITEAGQQLQVHVCQHLGDDPLGTALAALSAEQCVQLERILEVVVEALPSGAEALENIMQLINDNESKH